MEVTSPATLSEGYEFKTIAPVSGNIIRLTVPKGGVEKRQKFYIPVNTGSETNANGVPALEFSSSSDQRQQQVSIPVGHWRDSVCSCFAHGIICPRCLMSWCCTLCKFFFFF